MPSMPGLNAHIRRFYGATRDEVVPPGTCEGWLLQVSGELPVREIDPHNDEFKLCGEPVAATGPDDDWSRLDSSERWLTGHFCKYCLPQAVRVFRRKEKKREDREVRKYRRQRCLQALQPCSDSRLIAAVETHQGDLAAALKSLVPSDIPKLQGFFLPLQEELNRRGLTPVVEHARLQGRIETLRQEMVQAMEELAAAEPEAARIKERVNSPGRLSDK